MDKVWQELMSASGSEIMLTEVPKFLKFPPCQQTVTASFMEVIAVVRAVGHAELGISNVTCLGYKTADGTLDLAPADMNKQLEWTRADKLIILKE
jgi:hypothetical protein